LWSIDDDGRGARPLVAGWAFSAVITPDDRHVIFLSSRHGRQSPWIVPIEGAEEEEIADTFAGSGSGLAVTRDNRLLFRSTGTFVVCDLPRCGNRRDVPLPPDFKAEGAARWMPDGRAIAYVCDRGMNLCTLPLDDRSPQQLTRFTDRTIASFAFSHDGTQLAITRTTTTSDIVLFSAR
jgi:Tol biopolymer transport system component